MAEVVGGWSPSPGHRTFSQAKDEIERYVGMPDDSRVEQIAEDGIREAIRKVNMADWNWTLATHDVTLLSTSGVYTGPSDFRKEHNTVFLDTNDKPVAKISFLEPKSFQTTQARDLALSLGTYRYTIFNTRTDGQITLDFTPDATFVASRPTMRLLYYKYIPYPTSDSEVLCVPSEAESYVLWFAKAYAASIVAPDKYSLARQESEDSWKKMVKEDKNRGDW